MLERRPLFGLLVLLTVCLSIWRISLQEPSMVATEVSYTNQYQLQSVHLRFLQQQQQTSQTSLYRTLTRTLSPPLEVGDTIRWINRIRSQSTKQNGINSTTLLYLTSSSTSDLSSSSNNRRRNSSSTSNSSFQAHNYFSGNLSLASPSASNVNNEILPKDDFNSLIDLHDFEFVMNQVSCSMTRPLIAPLLLILVHSAPGNLKKRLLIRETWGSWMDQSYRLIFLLGTVNTTDLQKSLEMENNSYGDMVQGNFIDAYRNMTYKHVMALKWFSYYCPEAKYVLKTDDDVFINTPFLLKYLKANASRHDLLFCQKIFSSRVKRSYRSKWRVSTKEYPGRYYPTYCPGYSIIYSQDVAFRLYNEAQRTRYFWIDDVHVTGTLSQKANVTITPFTSYVLKKSDCEDILAGKTDIDNFLFSWPDIQEDQTRSLWNLIRDIS